MTLNCNATIEKPITSGTVIYFTSSNLVHQFPIRLALIPAT